MLTFEGKLGFGGLVCEAIKFFNSEQYIIFSTSNLMSTTTENTSKKETIQSGERLSEVADEVYRCDEPSMNELLESVTTDKIIDLLVEDDSFFQRAAKELSYYSLTLVINLGLAAYFPEHFTPDSPIFKTFMTNLNTRSLSDFELKRIMVALMDFNREGIKAAIRNSGNARLILMLAEIIEKQDKYFKDMR